MSTEELARREAHDAKALYSLYCDLSLPKFSHISTYSSAKEIWDRLQVTFERTDGVKETNMKILLEKYETFEMKSDKTITQMNTGYFEITKMYHFWLQKI